MAKKRSCRRTTDEDRIHDRAVKMRKMTDRQLVQYVEEQVEAARREGAARERAQAPRLQTVDIGAILKDIRGIRGIGDAKLDSIGAILGRSSGCYGKGENVYGRKMPSPVRDVWGYAQFEH